MKRLAVLLFISVAALLDQGCCLVDEDLNGCYKEADVTMDYELRMVTNMKTEIQTQLSMNADIHVSAVLNAYLEDIFTDYARDVDLGFYDVTRLPSGDSLRLEHMQRAMNANEKSFSLNIPFRDYMHLAVANCEDNGPVSLKGNELCHHSTLSQEDTEVTGCHKTGLFTARLGMSMKEGVNQEFQVNLYMANCASALVLDKQSSNVADLKVFATGFATDFCICDSTYLFRRNQDVRAERLDPEEGSEICFVTVNFPSRDPENEETKVVIETTDPFVAEEQDHALWSYKVFATLLDGTINLSTVRIRVPLRAGQLKIIRVRMTDEGIVSTDDPTVGVTVSLNWENGQSFNEEL